MKRFALIIVLSAALFGTGCSDPYGVAAKLAQDVAVSVNQADLTVDQLRVAGTISDTEERSILGYLSSLNTLDGVYIGCVQAAHANSKTTGGFTACAQTFATAMGNPDTLAALHVSNPNSQQTVTAVARAIVALVNATVAALGGK